MKDVFRTNDPVELTFIQAVLAEADIECFVLDDGMSSAYAGALPFIKRRVMVIDEDEHMARTAIARALDERESGEDQLPE